MSEGANQGAGEVAGPGPAQVPHLYGASPHPRHLDPVLACALRGVLAANTCKHAVLVSLKLGSHTNVNLAHLIRIN